VVILADWSDLFVAAAGASAALAGLIIVAMSVNIETIVKFETLPSRAAATIALMVLVVVVSIGGLVPELPIVPLGWIVVAASLVGLVVALESGWRMVKSGLGSGIAKSLVVLAPIVAMAIGGGMLAAGDITGLYAIAAGMALAFVGAVLNSWVLLVEIRR
jgi:hypothetical protein